MPSSMLSTARFLRRAMGDFACAPALRRSRPTLPVPGWIAGDSHTHSDISDGMVPIEEQVAWAAANGHGWIGIVDHGDGVEGNLASFLRRCKAAGEASGIAVLPGVELTARLGTYSPRDKGDMVVFGVGPESKLPPNQGLKESALLRHAHGGRTHPLRVIAHPTLLFKRWSHWDPRHIEGVELATGTGRARPATLRRWFDLGRRAVAAGMRWPVGLAGSDGHAPWQTPGLGGMTWVRIGEGASPEEVRRALLRGRAVVSTRGDFACLSVDGASSGDTALTSGRVEVELTVRPAHARTCSAVTIYDEHARVVACRVAPADGDVIRISGTAPRLLIGHFEFCQEDGFAVGDVCTNPLILNSAIDEPSVLGAELLPEASADVA